MKKLISYIVIVTALLLILCGCSAENRRKKQNDPTEVTSQPFTERVVDTVNGSYIYDKAGLLDENDLKACNDYAGWLYTEKLINAAVVTTNDLGGKSPSDFALDEYNRIYEGKGSGLLVLINNDTNEDFIWRTGSCLSEISQTSEKNAIYWSTKEIMGGSYRRGIMRLLQLGELCSDHIIDNTQVFEFDEITALDKAMASCKYDVTLLASRNGSDTPNEDILKSYYTRKYTDGSGIMLMIDTNKKSLIAYSDDNLPSELEKALKPANALAAKDDYFGAVNKIIEAIDG